MKENCCIFNVDISLALNCTRFGCFADNIRICLSSADRRCSLVMLVMRPPAVLYVVTALRPRYRKNRRPLAQNSVVNATSYMTPTSGSLSNDDKQGRAIIPQKFPSRSPNLRDMTFSSILKMFLDALRPQASKFPTRIISHACKKMASSEP